MPGSKRSGEQQMVADKIEVMGATLVELARPGMTHKQLFEAVRREHPKASKKEIVRAAFYALTLCSDAEPDKAGRLQDFALVERVGS
jgi:hypothetical protein